MEEWINRLSDQPAFAALMIALLGAVLFFLFRRLLTMALLAFVAFAGTVGYFAYTGKEPPRALKTITEKAREGAEALKDKAKEASEKISDAAKTTVKDAVDDAVDDVIDD